MAALLLLIAPSSASLARLIFKTVVRGSTNYLLALSNPSLKAASAINTATLKAIRTALRLDDSALNSLVWDEGRAPRGEAIMARERHRFCNQNAHFPI